MQINGPLITIQLNFLLLNTSIVALHQEQAFPSWPVLELSWMKAVKYHAMPLMEKLQELLES
jgi:hypothetical protein